MSASYLALDWVRWLMVALIPLMVLTASAGGYWLSTRALAPAGHRGRAFGYLAEYFTRIARSSDQR